MSDDTTETGDEPAEGRVRGRAARWLHRWRWPLAGGAAVLFVVLLAYGIVPLVIRHVTIGELEAMGATEVAIGAVDFDPLDGVTTVTDLAVTGREGDRLTAETLIVDLDFVDLFDRRIHLPDIAVAGALLDVRRLQTGGILFAGLAPGSEASDAEGSGWQFGFGKLDIARSRLRYVEPDFETTLVLDDLSFGRVLAWQPEEASDFHLSGTLGESKVSVEGTAMPFAPVNRGDLQLDLSDLDLSTFGVVFRDAGLPPIKGLLAARIALTTALSASASPRISVNGQVELRDSRLPLEEGALSAKRMSWSGRIDYDGAKTAYLDLNGSLKSEALRLAAGEDPVDLGALSWNGRVALSEPGDNTLALQLDGSADLSGVAVGDGASRKLALRSVAVEDLKGGVTFGAGGALGLDQNGAIRIEGVDLEDAGQAVRLEALSWRGKIARKADGSTLTLRGSAEATALVVRDEAADETARLNKLELTETALDLTQGPGTLGIVHDGPIVATGGEVESPVLTAREGRVAWTGRITASVSDDGRVEGDLDGSLRIEDMVMRLASPSLSLRYDSLSFAGRTSIVDAADGALTSRTTGRSEMEKMALTDESRALKIVSVERISVEGIEGNERGLDRADSLDASDIWIGVPLPDEEGLSPYSHQPMHVGKIRADKVGRFDAGAMRFGDVTVTDLSFTAVRDLAGEIQLPIVVIVGPEDGGASEGQGGPRAPAAADPAAPAAQRAGTDGAPAAPGGPTVAIGSLSVAGQSRLSFIDQAIEPNFHETLKDLSLTLEGLDGAKPDDPARLTLSGTLGEFSTVGVEGMISPFADPASSDLEIDLEGIELPPLSAYSARYLGYRLDTGQLDATIDLKISGTELEAQSNLDIRQLTLDLEGDAELRALRKELGIPIETGLDLLRDSKGDVALSVPVTGELGDPQFDFSDAINQAVGAAMKNAVLTVLFPLGAVIAATEGSGPANIKLEPIDFRPGTKEITAAGRDLLDKAAGILSGHEGVTMRLCGFAVPADAEALAAAADAETPAGQAPESETPAEEGQAPAGTGASGTGGETLQALPEHVLGNLAAERAILVKSILVDDHGIEPERLLLCRPAVQKDAGEPRIEILL